MLVAALLALPAGSAAKGGGGQVDRLAAQQCKAERQELGRSGFRKKYGAQRGMRSCIRRIRARVKAAAETGARDCQAELAEIGLADFNEAYGDDETGAGAMEECVREVVEAVLDDDYEDDGGTEDED